jgi:hypothetical protein
MRACCADLRQKNDQMLKTLELVKGLPLTADCRWLHAVALNRTQRNEEAILTLQELEKVRHFCVRLRVLFFILSDTKQTNKKKKTRHEDDVPNTHTCTSLSSSQPSTRSAFIRWSSHTGLRNIEKVIEEESRKGRA